MTNAVYKKEDFIRSGHHTFKKGSEKVVIGEQTLYIHEPSLHLIVYTGESYLWINNVYESHLQFQNEVSKLIRDLKQQAAPKVKHSLVKGVILASHTQISDVSRNMVEFYEVVDVVDEYHVRVCLIGQQVFEYENYKSAVPLAGDFQGEPIERRVIVDSIKIAGSRVAVPANFQTYNLAGLEYKIYTPYQFGLVK